MIFSQPKLLYVCSIPYLLCVDLIGVIVSRQGDRPIDCRAQGSTFSQAWELLRGLKGWHKPADAACERRRFLLWPCLDKGKNFSVSLVRLFFLISQGARQADWSQLFHKSPISQTQLWSRNHWLIFSPGVNGYKASITDLDTELYLLS